MKKNYLFRISLVITVLFMSVGCVEEIDLQTETVFEEALVVEATITNEFKKQEIKLSRSYPLETDGPRPELGANVEVVASNGNSYQFQEDEPGIYLSSFLFSAEPNVDYNLEITTNDGEMYSSSSMQLTQETQIDDVFFEVGLNENNEEGISILVNSFDPSSNSKFYRYTFEETYKIIAPKWSPIDLVVLEYNFPTCPIFGFQPKQEEQLTCYNTEISKDIILENTNLFEEDRIDRFKVRFLNRNNYIISHRYSILVRQYVQSSQAHVYYKTLRDLSSSESVLSQSQPGFIEGNVYSVSNGNEKVVGFFEVSSVDSRRIYFNYEDMYPNQLLPPYYINCNPFAPANCNPAAGVSPIADALSESQGAKFYDFNVDADPTVGDYDLVLAPCGNCTVLGKNVPPDFWVD